jgi:hypothetical protein
MNLKTELLKTHPCAVSDCELPATTRALIAINGQPKRMLPVCAQHADAATEDRPGLKEVTIFSLWTKAAKNHVKAVRYSVQVPAGRTPQGTLENAFKLTNRDDRRDTVCSTSAGDLMLLDGQAYLVEFGGYHPLTEAEMTAVLALWPIDTTFGYDWLTEQQKLLPAHRGEPT